MLKKFLSLLLLLILVSVPAANMIAVHGNCMNLFDIAIYHQALINMFGEDGINPFLTVRGLHIFNDHFDVVVVFAATVVQAMGASIWATILFEWFCYLIFIATVYWLKKEWKSGEFLLFAFLTVFSRGIVAAQVYPVHASFWSMAVWACVVWSLLHTKSRWPLFVSAFGLCLFKESYAVVVAFLGLGLLGLGGEQRKRGYFVFALGFLWFLVAVPLRPYIVGSFNNYGHRLFEGFFTNPIGYVQHIFLQADYRGFLKTMAPLILLLSFHLYRSSKAERKQWVFAFLLLFPLFVLQWVWGSFILHYAFPFFAVVLSLIVFQGGITRLAQSPKIAALTVIVFLLSVSSVYEKAAKMILFQKSPKCIWNAEKNQQTAQIIDMFREPEGIAIASTNGITPRLLRRGLKVYSVPHGEVEPTAYTHIILERNGSGDTYPISKDTVESFKQSCAPYATKVIFDDQYYYVAQGNFPNTCLNL